MMHQNITNHDIEETLANHFQKWFHDFVLSPENGVLNQCLHDLAHGPSRKVRTWPIYFVNGYKFHTAACSEGKKTNNSGVCVKGTGNVNTGEDDFYGILKEVIELEYPGTPLKRLTLFLCEWFDPMLDRGMKVHKEYGIVEVKHGRRYPKYDPFIFAHQATQVYYVPYPKLIREKRGWWVAIKTKPRAKMEGNVILQGAYQNEEGPSVQIILQIEPIDSLHDINGGVEEVEALTLVGDDITEEEEEEDEELQNEEEESSFSYSNDSSQTNNNDDQFNYSNDSK